MRLFAVVVAYHPQAEQLAGLCRTLVTSGARVVIVDNTEADVPGAALSMEHCTLVALGKNAGIAHAQNLGITMAMDRGADVIVFFDQDSEPNEAFLGRLLKNVEVGKPGVVAPVCTDKTTSEELPSFQVNRLGLRRKIYSAGRHAPYPVDLVIASGSAATAVTFSQVGKMDEDFFIDFVDFEWCFRCRSRSVPIRVVPDAVMQHSIGDRTVDLRFIRGSVHGVPRTYYKIRNCFLLLRKPDVPMLYAMSAGFHAIMRFFLLLPSMKEKLSYVGVLFTAVWHGVIGVVGKNPATGEGRR